jgi:hypothetical protein
MKTFDKHHPLPLSDLVANFFAGNKTVIKYYSILGFGLKT